MNDDTCSFWCAKHFEKSKRMMLMHRTQSNQWNVSIWKRTFIICQGRNSSKLDEFSETMNNNQ